jgi:hypothetical protein
MLQLGVEHRQEVLATYSICEYHMLGRYQIFGVSKAVPVECTIDFEVGIQRGCQQKIMVIGIAAFPSAPVEAVFC